jgi:hypothetical protein
MVSHINRITYIDTVWKQGTEDNIQAYERGNNTRIKKIT